MVVKKYVVFYQAFPVVRSYHDYRILQLLVRTQRLNYLPYLVIYLPYRTIMSCNDFVETFLSFCLASFEPNHPLNLYQKPDCIVL